MTKLICMIGPINGGKDFRANQFKSDSRVFGYSMEHINFADELREMMWDLLDWRPKNNKEYEEFKTGTMMMHEMSIVTNYQTDIDITGRELLQNLGTEVMRKRVPNFWSDMWRGKVEKALDEGKNVVCSDLRFINEYKTALGVSTGKDKNPPKKEFIYCCYKPEERNLDAKHSSEVLACELYKAGCRDGDIIPFDLIENIISRVEKGIRELEKGE